MLRVRGRSPSVQLPVGGVRLEAIAGSPTTNGYSTQVHEWFNFWCVMDNIGDQLDTSAAMAPPA
jgi:hypothetical protein